MVSQCFFVSGEISPNFDLKYMILADREEFFMEKMALIRQISQKKIPNRQIL